MKISSKISLSFLITAIILTFFGASIFYIVGANSLKKTTFEYLDTTAALTASRIESFLEEHKGHISMLSEMESLKNIFRLSSDAEQTSGILMKLKEHAKTAYIRELIVLDSEGRVAASLNREDIGKDLSSKIDMSEAKENSYVRDFHTLESDKEIFYIYKFLEDDETGKLSGILLAGISMDLLNKITRDKSGLGETEKKYIVNMDGIMITRPVVRKGSHINQEEGIKTILMNIEKGLVKEKGTSIFTDYRGKKIFRTYRYMPHMNWVLFVEVDESEILTQINRLKTIFIIIIFFVPAITWLTGVFVSKAITTPINELHEGIEIVGSGNLDHKVGTSSGDEIGALSRAFDVMTSDLKKTTASINDLNREIIERKRMEEALASRTRALARSNEELQQFASIASHDLQEPLRTVTNYVQLLAKRYKGRLDQDADEFIGFVEGGTEKMRALVKGLRLYSHIGTHGKPFTKTKGESVVKRALTGLQKAIEKSKAEITYDPLPEIMADEGQLAQLFQNLISNAIKFNDKEPPRVHISALKDGDNQVFSVKDNGIGIEEKNQERVFHIFQRFQSQSEYAGTEIGLTLCRRIVERHGGRIWIESEPGQAHAPDGTGQGTTFYFTIPDGSKIEKNASPAFYEIEKIEDFETYEM